MTEPDDNLRRAYEAYRHREGPSKQQRAEMWEGIEELISAGQSGPRLIEPAARSNAPAWARSVAIVAAVAAAVALLWAVADFGGVMVQASGSTSGSQAIDQAKTAEDGGRAVQRQSKGGRATADPRPTQSATVPMSVAPLEVVPTGTVAVAPTDPRSASTKPPEKTKRTRTPDSPVAEAEPPPSPEPAVQVEPEPTTIVEEAAVLRRARAALASGEASRALTLVREHARRFSDGVLAPERGLLEVDVLCQLDRVDDARAAANRYAKRFPDSGWNARIARSCAR